MGKKMDTTFDRLNNSSYDIRMSNRIKKKTILGKLNNGLSKPVIIIKRKP